MSRASEARKLVQPVAGDAIRLLQDLVRVNTVSVPPRGNEAAGQKVLRDFLIRQGIDNELYETEFVSESGHACLHADHSYRGRPNLLARLPGGGRGRSLLFNGHMDTVPEGRGKWSASPWSGEIRDGRLYGRGSIDMKGGLVSGIAVLLALRRAGLRLSGDLFCDSVVDEEWGGGGGTLASGLRGLRADAAVIPEGTNLEVALATRGGTVIDLVCEAGDPAGYFSTAEVVSPAVPMGRLLGWVDGEIQKRRGPGRGAYADFPDPTPFQVLAVEANRFDPDVPWSVPLRGSVRIYLQFLPDEDPAQVLAGVRGSLEEFCRKDPFFRANPVAWQPAMYPPLLGHELPAGHPWSRCFVAAAGDALGRAPRVAAAPYPCDAFLLQREFGIPTLLFGPSGGGAHNADEYVEVDSVIETAVVLLTAALEWCA